MDALRNAMGYGAQSGQEPLSGQTGQGTASEPYDAGNAAGQSGAPAFEATSTNPTGTSQFDTGTDTKLNTTTFAGGDDSKDNSQYNTGDTKTSTSETLAAGVTGDSHGPVDAPADSQPPGTTSVGETAHAADKGTDETRGADEQVTSEKSHTTNDSNANAQDTFFANASLSKDEAPEPPKFTSEVADKDPFPSSNDAPPSNITEEPSSQSAAPSSSDTTSGIAGGSDIDKVASSAPDKNYKTADTESHSQSSAVLSSATPGAALNSPPKSQTSDYNDTTEATPSSDYDNTTTATTTATGGSGYGNDTTSSSGYDNKIPSTTTSTTAAAADTDYPSPKTQPTESAGGLAGVSHNTGSAPSAPHTGVPDSSLNPDSGLGAGENHGEGKKKMSERIKEKLHMGKK
ncbi:MAG: hypothetical protein Q9172_000336 [Xanthocarpia lactea]